VTSVEHSNGEIHFILKEFESYVFSSIRQNFGSVSEIKKIMKKEALKPLFLMRE
jgi:hypothetical protein